VRTARTVPRAAARKEAEFCEKCFDTGEHCMYCHFSRESMYYQNYHSAYYVDYYTGTGSQAPAAC
jgi:hypothetical protein